eukprot:CAMPEP_0168620054 /NCGR_PEP_ID=MMETSP0449_2-20121227/6929_1 /TAXON_ID=1082188 /ORGANISM="Strombidium rassoulzadegani, Strain ras09" /LENGTH=106 /DNA_ID=CAMNT_0008661027 /DNA_START=610 /DNA_END=930 /DNA_ORIENTATION=-
MDDVGAVDVEAASQQLVHEVLAVVVGQVLPRVDHSVHVGFHQVSDDVNVLVASLCRRLLNVYQSDDVLMVEELEELDLSYDSLGVDEVFKGFGDFFNGYLRLDAVV